MVILRIIVSQTLELDEFEVGIGTVTDAATDTLSRDTVISNNLGTTNEIDFGAGEKEVFCTIPAKKQCLQ
jgi:hypothetical protein